MCVVKWIESPQSNVGKLLESFRVGLPGARQTVTPAPNDNGKVPNHFHHSINLEDIERGGQGGAEPASSASGATNQANPVVALQDKLSGLKANVVRSSSENVPPAPPAALTAIRSLLARVGGEARAGDRGFAGGGVHGGAGGSRLLT